MEQLILHKKTGFKNHFPTRPIVIRDFRGIEFYSTIGLSPVSEFNLPEGYYFIEQGQFSELTKPVSYKEIPMPTVERFIKSPEHFTISFGENLNKCTIDWATETILFDNSLSNSPLPHLYFILYHEFGHARYHTERYADLYAANMMLKRGYNPSQIGLAPLEALSERQFERKNFLINKML